MTHDAHSHTQVVGHTHAAHSPPVSPLALKKRGTGFWLAAISYFILSFFSILSLGYFVWLLLAFLIIPVLTGIITGRRQGSAVGGGGCFAAGMRAAGVPMAIYTAISLTIVHSHVGPSPSASATFLVGFAVAIVYALIAGLIAGMTALIVARQQG